MISTTINKTFSTAIVTISSIMLAVAMPLAAQAAGTVTVIPTNQQGWYAASNAGGSTSFVSDTTAPSGYGDLRLTTSSTPGGVAQYLHDTSTPLADVNYLGYWTKSNTSAVPPADPSYQLTIQVNGLSDTTAYTTLVFDPYQNSDQGAVNSGWEQWDVAAGKFWSTRTATCNATNTVISGSTGGPATYTLSSLKAMCPQAVVTGFGVSVGAGNVSSPGYDVQSDLFNFNGAMYDFEPSLAPTNKSQCLNGGWTKFNNPYFKSQADCIKYASKL